MKYIDLFINQESGANGDDFLWLPDWWFLDGDYGDFNVEINKSFVSPRPQCDLVLFAGCADLELAFTRFKELRGTGLPVIFAPQYSGGRYSWFAGAVWNLFQTFYSHQDFAHRFSKLVQSMPVQDNKPKDKERALMEGIASNAPWLLFSSRQEKDWFAGSGYLKGQSALIYDAIHFQLPELPDASLFAKRFGLKDYIICDGGISPSKNQLLLAYILKDCGIPLVIAGTGEDRQFESLLLRINKNVLIFENRQEDTQLLASAYLGARMFVDASLGDSASPAAMFAAMLGCNTALADKPLNREYFKDFAEYFPFTNLDSLKDNIFAAYENAYGETQKEEMRQYMEERFSRADRIEKLVRLFNSVLNASVVATNNISANDGFIYIDLSACGQLSGTVGGMGRVEHGYAKLLYELCPDRVRFIIWNRSLANFLSVSVDDFISNRLNELYGRQFQLDEIATTQNLPTLGSGDIIVNLGGLWTFNEQYMLDLQGLVKTSEAFLFTLVHDLIPVVETLYYTREQVEEFTKNMRLLLEVSDCVMAISQNTARDLYDFANRHGLCPGAVKIIRYGDGFISMDLDEKLELEPILEKIGSGAFILYVSSLNIRKNHIFLLRLWRRMIARFGEKNVPHLVCVGGRGLMCDHLLQLLEHDTITRNRIHIFHSINDPTLLWLYKNCLFTVYPSLYEGWGLPVSESISMGKLCLTSNASSTREIAPDYSDLLDPEDFAAWQKKLGDYIFNPALRKEKIKKLSSFQGKSWESSARDMLALLNSLKVKREKIKILDANSPVEIPGSDEYVYMAGGWAVPDKDGVWTNGKRAALMFDVFNDGQRMEFDMACKRFTARKLEPLAVDVFINGVFSAFFELDDSSAGARFTLPPGLLKVGEFAKLRIEFVINNPKRPCDYKKSGDRRLLGFKMSRFQISALKTN